MIATCEPSREPESVARQVRREREHGRWRVGAHPLATCLVGAPLEDMGWSRRFAIPLIGIAGRSDSTLIARSDVGLVLPAAREACPMGLAPTTSTTMTLALGDALAVALMGSRDFTPEDFRGFHPGGRLGARLATVAHLMHSGDEVPLIGTDAPMGEALLEISAKGFGVVGVLEGGALAGIINALVTPTGRRTRTRASTNSPSSPLTSTSAITRPFSICG